jgi:adenine phosphoribosyltransferase
MSIETIKSLIRDVPDFPKPGIIFKDITPLLADPSGFRATVDLLSDRARDCGADGILAIESRGFIFGAALAQRLELPMHLVRKKGKLPRQVISQEYSLEYGVDNVEVHSDALEAGASYLIVDDLIATGGTAGAVVKLVERREAIVAACLFVIELSFLNGRNALGDHVVDSLLQY